MKERYNSTDWINGNSPYINEDNLDNIEKGITNNDERTQRQEFVGDGIFFNGMSSKAESSTFTSFNAETIYLKVKPSNLIGGITVSLAASQFILYNSASTGKFWRIHNAGNDTYASTEVDLKVINNVVFRWNGTTYDIIVNGVKLGLTDGSCTQWVPTEFNLGFYATTGASYDHNVTYEARVSSTNISEADAISLTSGLKSSEEVMPIASTELVYLMGDETTISNEGTTATADLTGTDLTLYENVTSFCGNIAKGGSPVLSDEDKPLFKAFKSATTSTPGNTLIDFDSISFDTNNAFDTVAHEYTIPEDGYYEIVCQLAISSPQDQSRYGPKLQINGVDGPVFKAGASGTGFFYSRGAFLERLMKGDVIRILSDFDNTKNVVGGNDRLSFFYAKKERGL